MKKTILAWLSALLLTCLSTHASARPPSFVQSNGALSHWPVFGAVATTFTSYGGSQGNTWEVGGPTGPLWNNNAGAFEAKTPGGSFAVVRGATPIASNDLTSKAYADGHVTGSVLSAPPGSGTSALIDTSGTLSWGGPPVGSATGLLPLANLTPGTNGQFLSTVAGASAWAALPGITQPGATLVCNPAGPAGPNVFTTWSSLMTAANAVVGPVNIVITGTCHVTTGTWTFNNGVVNFSGGIAAFANLLAFDNGAQITEPTSQDTYYSFRNVFVESASSSPAWPIPDGNVGFVEFDVFDGGFLGSHFFLAPTAPLIKTGPLGTTEIRSSVYNGRIGSGLVGVPVTFDFTTSTVTSNTILLFARAILQSNSITTNGAGTEPETDVYSDSALWGNAPNVALGTAAVADGYNDTLVSPTLGATQVQGAIDALKLKTLPATSSNGNVLTVVGGAWASAAPSGGSGITQSTGDVVMGPGSGSQVATVEAISGSSPFHITPPILEWNAGVSAPSLTQVVAASGAGQTMALQAQGGATGANGGQLNLLSGAAGSGGQNGEVLMGTPDGLNLVTASPASVDLLSSHNYRIGNWASTFGSGVGEVLVKDDASQPGALVSGGFSFGSHSGNFTINSPSAAFRPYITSPTILQEQAAAATSGQTLTVEAQPGGSGNTNGGALNLQSGPGQGTGVAGAVALSTGDGLNQIALYPGASGAFSRLSFSGGIQQPLFTQETAPSGLNGLTLTIRPQTGGAGSTDGGNLLLTPGIMGSAGTGTNGQLIFQSIDQSNTLEMGDDLFALNPTSPTPITAGNASSQSSVGLNYMPAITYSAGQRFTQIVAEEKFVDVCHIVAPSSSTGNCETGIPMQVSGQMHVHLVTQCRVTTAGSGTTVNDNVTSDGFGDWVNTTGGSGAPTPNGTAVYGQVSSGTPGVFNPIVYTFTGATTGGHGFAGAPYVVSTASGRNLGTLDCTTWADDKFN